MDIVAIGSFTIGGFLGIYMLGFVLKKVHIPKSLALIHGILMAFGFTLLIAYNLTIPKEHKHWQSVAIFSVAIVLGLIAVWRDISHKDKNIWVILVHGLIGFSGILLLYLHTLKIL